MAGRILYSLFTTMKRSAEHVGAHCQAHRLDDSRFVDGDSANQPVFGDAPVPQKREMRYAMSTKTPTTTITMPLALTNRSALTSVRTSRRRLQRVLGRLVLSGPLSSWLCRRTFRSERDHAPSVGTLLPPERGDQSLEVVAVFGGKGFPVGPDFFDDGIAPHTYASKSSSGVQMTGARSPSARQVSSIFPRTAAFAMCRQFHVRR